MTTEHLASVLKEVIPCYLERDDLEGLAQDLAIYIAKHSDEVQGITDELSDDLLILKETDD